MSPGMNWARARMEGIIAERGSERFYEVNDIPQPDRNRAAKSSRKRRSKPKRRTDTSVQPTRRGRAGTPPQRPVADSPEVAQRRRLRREFERLSRDERARRATEYRSRLRALSSSRAA